MALSSQAFDPKASRGLDIESILSAPLVAAATANSMMAREQTRFLLEFCFSKKGDQYRPVMIPMTLTRSVMEPGEKPGDPARMERIHTTFHVPLLSLVPINALAVQAVSVDFELELTSQRQVDYERAYDPAEERAQTPAPKAQLRGHVSYDTKERTQIQENQKQQYHTEDSSSLKVNIQAGQLPLSPGLTALLDLYTKSMAPTTPEQEKSRSQQQAP